MLDLILKRLKLLSTGNGNSKPSAYAQYKVYDSSLHSRVVVSNRETPTPLTRKESQESILNDIEEYQIRRTDDVYVEYEMQPPRRSSSK